MRPLTMGSRHVRNREQGVLEQSTFGRKNLVVATSDSALAAPISVLQILDPPTGTLIWTSHAIDRWRVGQQSRFLRSQWRRNAGNDLRNGHGHVPDTIELGTPAGDSIDGIGAQGQNGRASWRGRG